MNNTVLRAGAQSINNTHMVLQARNIKKWKENYGILKHEEGIDLMSGNIELSGLEVSLVNVMLGDYVAFLCGQDKGRL